MVLKTRVSMDAFLAEPERDEAPYLELMDGEVYEKAMGGSKHAAIAAYLVAQLFNYLRRTGEGRVSTELRHVHRPLEWVFLPDVSVTLRSRQPEPPGARTNEPVDVLPDLAIEILSPDDRFGRVARKTSHYMEAGVPLLWVVDPEAENITVFRPGEAPVEATAPEKLSAAPVLESFELDLAELFASLRD